MPKDVIIYELVADSTAECSNYLHPTLCCDIMWKQHTHKSVQDKDYSTQMCVECGWLAYLLCAYVYNCPSAEAYLSLYSESVYGLRGCLQKSPCTSVLAFPISFSHRGPLFQHHWACALTTCRHKGRWETSWEEKGKKCGAAAGCVSFPPRSKEWQIPRFPKRGWQNKVVSPHMYDFGKMSDSNFSDKLQ